MGASTAMPLGAARLLAALVLLLSPPGHADPKDPASSLLLLIDVSGSMGDQIGNGNGEVKIVAAKLAAVAAVRQAAKKGTAEVAVLAFEGDCAQPVPRHAGFTTDYAALERFIGGLQPGGGTPMAAAVLVANRFMKDEGASTARDRMIVLLADGQNDCGDVADALAELKASGVIFRHETVGFGIEPDSGAARDLRDIATASGGAYHHAADATQLGDLFVRFVDTFTVIDMLGMFGGGRGAAAAGAPGQPPTPSAQPAAGAPRPASQPAPSAKPATGQVSGLLGQFKAKTPAAAPDEPAPAGQTLCYRQFRNPSGLAGLGSNAVTEFTCAASCRSLDSTFYGTGETKVDDPAGMTCAAQCAYAAGTESKAGFVWGRSITHNHCVVALDPLRPPATVVHYYCDYSDNKHRVAWERGTPATGEFRVYLNHYPERNGDAELLGETRGDKFDFEYGINFHDDPAVDGMNLWNPFPQAGVSACNKYGICTPVVYGELEADCGP